MESESESGGVGHFWLESVFNFLLESEPESGNFFFWSRSRSRSRLAWPGVGVGVGHFWPTPESESGGVGHFWLESESLSKFLLESEPESGKKFFLESESGSKPGAGVGVEKFSDGLVVGGREVFVYNFEEFFA